MGYSVLTVFNDNDPFHEEILGALQGAGYEAIVCSSVGEAIKVIKERDINIVLGDISLPGMDGLKMLDSIKRTRPHVELIFISSTVSTDKVVEAMKAGAYDFYEKPVDFKLLNQIIKKALEKQRLYIDKIELERQLKERLKFKGVIGRSKKMQQVLETVRMVAPKRSNCLICGESGTGKELIARTIHYNSPRHDKPFIAINCAALSEGILESELFGHEKGAFTGAIAKRLGRFELANGGTIFLDEVADIPLATQIKLLRVLQEKEFERVGGNETIKVDVRIISATNRDLKRAIEEKRFREDLYYRLNVVQINLPPLRERRDDIPLLVSNFIRKYNADYGYQIKGITKEAMHILMNYQWPGNVRELENALEAAIALTEEEVIDERYLPSFLLLNPTGDREFIFTFGTRLKDIEKEILIETVNRFKGNKTKAAKTLGIGLRTLQRKLKTYSTTNPRILKPLSDPRLKT